MILLWILIGLFALGGYLLYRSSDIGGKRNFGWVPGYCFLGSMLGAILYVFVTTILQATLQTTSVMNLDCKIISMTNAEHVEGNFILGTGSINGVRSYLYKIQYADGGVREYTAPVYGTTVYETNDAPCVKRFVRTISYDISFLNVVPNSDYYCFYVPKGCIIKEFKIQ